MKVQDIFNTNILIPKHLQKKTEEQKADEALYEGLIKSYPMLRTIENVHYKLKCQTQKLLKDDRKSYYNCFAINGEMNSFDFQILLDVLNKCGWYIVLIKFYNGKKQLGELKKNISIDSIKENIKEATSFSLKVEAKFDVELDRKRWPAELFCLAPLKVKDKIKKTGLVPKSGANLDNQPERIYFAINKNKLIREMLPQLKKNDVRYEEGTILMTLDTTKFNNKTRLFEDINWPDEAYYTLTNIPSYAITNITEL